MEFFVTINDCDARQFFEDLNIGDINMVNMINADRQSQVNVWVWRRVGWVELVKNMAEFWSVETARCWEISLMTNDITVGNGLELLLD